MLTGLGAGAPLLPAKGPCLLIKALIRFLILPAISIGVPLPSGILVDAKRTISAKSLGVLGSLRFGFVNTPLIASSRPSFKSLSS